MHHGDIFIIAIQCKLQYIRYMIILYSIRRVRMRKRIKRKGSMRKIYSRSVKINERGKAVGEMLCMYFFPCMHLDYVYALFYCLKN